MITFLIHKDDTNKKIECTLEDSISSLKKTIMKEFNLTGNYIDIDFQLERPIRSLGKFNLESGILPRSLDNYTFNRYGLDGRTIDAIFHEVHDYEPKKYDKKFKHVNIIKRKEGGETTVIEPIFDIQSEKDFPPLG